MILIKESEEDARVIINDLEEFVADRKSMLSNSEARKKDLENGFLKSFPEEHVSKLLLEEEGFIKRLSNVVNLSEQVLRELKVAFNKQFS